MAAGTFFHSVAKREMKIIPSKPSSSAAVAAAATFILPLSLETTISPIFDQLISCLHLLEEADDDYDDDAKRGKNHPHRHIRIIARLRRLRQLLGQLHDALQTALAESSSSSNSISNRNRHLQYNSSHRDDEEGNDGDDHLDDHDIEDALPPAAGAVPAATTIIVHQLDTIALPLLDILQREHWHTSCGKKKNSQNQKHHPCHLNNNASVVGGGDGYDNEKGKRTDAASMETEEMIRRSVNYSCMEMAASTLTMLWKLRQRMIIASSTIIDDDATTIANDKSSIQKVVVPSLIACAMALSSLDIADIDEDVEDGGDDDDIAVSTSAAAAADEPTTTLQQHSLDRGEDCAMAILSCIQSFVHIDAENGVLGSDCAADDNFDDGLFFNKNCVGMGSDDDDDVSFSRRHYLSREVGSAMRGALVARLVQGCLSFLSPKTSSFCAKRKNDNAELQLEALKTLRALLIGVPLPELWRSILPGCFAGLYQTALLRLQSLSSSMYSPSSSSFKRVAADTVRVLALLLINSLSTVSSSNKDNQQHQPQHLIDNSNNIQSITASLMAAVQQSSAKSNLLMEVNEKERGSISPNTVQSMSFPTSSEEEEKKKLAKEVNNRLVGPLMVLLSLLPTNRCKGVQKSGLYLCHILMIHTRTIWSESNYTALERKSLEFCLMMMVGEEEGDEDGTIELMRYSYNVIHSYKAHHQDGGWKRKLCQSIVPTILELMEVLPTYSGSGREMQVQHNLRLINGYLLISFRDMLNDNDIDLDWSSLSDKMRKSEIGQALACTEVIEVVKRTFSGERTHYDYCSSIFSNHPTQTNLPVMCPAHIFVSKSSLRS